MALRLSVNGKLGGLREDYRKYEKEVILGGDCPFTVVHQDPEGRVLTNSPVPLTPAGEPKMELWDFPKRMRKKAWQQTGTVYNCRAVDGKEGSAEL